MSGESPSRWALRCTAVLAVAFTGAALLCAVPQTAVAQIHGIPPSVTSIQNHFPPYLPNVPPSVTSLGPRGYVGPPAFPVYPRYPRTYPGSFGYGHRKGRGNGLGNYGYGGYVGPYYGPIVDYGYDQNAYGANVYSGPPVEQTLHIVVDMPPSTRSSVLPNDDEPVAAPMSSTPTHQPEVPPVESTTLVFRDGHTQNVTNYAIMGQTLYIFDSHTQKVGLGDLDIPATEKLNDDVGVEFHLPKAKQS